MTLHHHLAEVATRQRFCPRVLHDQNPKRTPGEMTRLRGAPTLFAVIGKGARLLEPAVVA